MTTSTEIGEWFDYGVEIGASHMLVATDWFDYEDYPIYVPKGEDPSGYRPKENRVMECYNLKMSKTNQLSEYRSNHWEYLE